MHPNQGVIRAAEVSVRNGGELRQSSTKAPLAHLTKIAELARQAAGEATVSASESEFHRVVRHETGHTMGFPHEHMRRELVEKIDPEKAIEFFGETQGWSPEEVRQQVLTPIEESSLLGTAHADPRSIMCYQIPGTITKDGRPIVGGLDIDRKDFAFAAKVYHKPVG